VTHTQPDTHGQPAVKPNFKQPDYVICPKTGPTPRWDTPGSAETGMTWARGMPLFSAHEMRTSLDSLGGRASQQLLGMCAVLSRRAHEF